MHPHPANFAASTGKSRPIYRDSPQIDAFPKDAQFIISTHSPVLLGYPGSQILSFDDGHLHPICYEDTAPMQIVRRFLYNRETFLDELFNDHPSLFEERHD